MRKYLALGLALLLCLVPLSTLARGESAPASVPAVESELLQEVQTPLCKAALLMDGDTGEVLYDYHGSDHNYPASITKVMTCLLTLEAVDRGELGLEQVITASNTFGTDLSADGSTQGIQAGEELTVHELLYCALVASANEACNILAEAVAGDIPSFVSAMNLRAAELGMTDTHFVNAHGLHNADHYTSAADLAVMVREALKNDTFRTIVSTKVHTVPATNLSPERVFGNTNALVNPNYYSGYTYAKAIGVKTGSTSEAGQCLASAAIDSGRTLICVVLGAENVKNEDGTVTRNAFAESKRLLEWGFESFALQELVDAKTPVTEVPVTLSADVTTVAVKPASGLQAILPVDVDPTQFAHEVTLYEETVQAPVEAGQELGEMTVRNGDKVYGTVKLVAAASAERSQLLYRLDQVKRFFGQLWVKIALVALAVLILVLILRFKVFGRSRRNRYGGRGGYRGRRR